MSGPEARIQSQVVTWLKWNGYMVFVIPNRGLYKDGRYNHVGKDFVAGIPDLEIPLSDGRTVRIELKSPVGKLSPAQEAMMARLVAMGHPCFVARSLDDVKNEFANKGYRP